MKKIAKLLRAIANWFDPVDFEVVGTTILFKKVPIGTITMGYVVTEPGTVHIPEQEEK